MGCEEQKYHVMILYVLLDVYMCCFLFMKRVNVPRKTYPHANFTSLGF